MKYVRVFSIVISLLFILSCFSTTLYNEEPPYDSDDLQIQSLESETKPQYSPTFPSNSRGASGNYLNLISEIGHGLNIGYENSLATGDVDNDGKDEVIFGNEDGYVHIVQYQDGDYVDEWRSPNLDWECYGLAVGDTDDDGTPEIVVGNQYGMLYIFGFQGPDLGYVKEWEYQLNKEEPFGLAVGDLDDDGYGEIVVGALQLVSTEENVFVFGFDGSTYVEEYRYLMTDFANYAHSVVIYDVDSDGTDEFIVGTREFSATTSARGTFYVFGYNGNDYTLEYKRPDVSDYVMDLDVGDVDDDGNPEIVVSGASVNIYQYEFGVYLIENSISEDHPKVQVGDVNNDDIPEIVTGSWELKIWQETTLLWESGPFEQEVYSILITDSDSDSKNEILFTKGVMDWYADLFILGYSGSSFVYEWISEYLPSISAISISDVNADSENDLVLATRPGELIIFENPKYQLAVKDAIRIDVGFEIIHVFCGNFDGDTTNDIVATDANRLVYFLEFDGANYQVVAQIEIQNGGFTAATSEDVDNDGKNELIIANFNGMVDVIGFEGSYSIEWEGLITDNGITAITTGDSDNDGDVEIIIGGFDYILYIFVYNGSEYVEIRSQLMAGMIFTLGVGDTNYDGNNELVVEVGYFELLVFHWNGTYYVVDWNMPFSEDAHNEAMDIGYIDSIDKDLIAIGTFELYVIGYNTDYETLFLSETFTFLIQCLIMGDLDESGTNEILISTGSYVFIYGKDYWAFASIFASKTEVLTGEEISFDGSQSKGVGTLMYYFDFGDGQNSGWTTESTSSHSYLTAGTYTVSLKIRDTNGNESVNSAKVTITVMEPNIIPVAYIDGIAPNPATKGESVSFSGHGTDEDGLIISYQWESTIDGFLGDENSFSSTLLSEGNHIISFKVLDDRDSWSVIVEESIEILPEIQNQIPSAFIDSISPNPGFEGDIITFSGSGVDEDGTIISYSWESQIHGELSTLSSFSVSSLAQGSHEISFKVQDDNEIWSEAAIETLLIEAVIPNRAPTGTIDSISPSSAQEGETVYFEGTGEDADGEIVSYSWESSIDGELSTQRSFSTSSLSLGEHVITFTVIDDKDTESDPVTMTIIIREKESEEKEMFNPVIAGIFVLIGILILATFLVISAKKKSGNNNQLVGCPFCGSPFRIATLERPVAVQCPTCGQTALVNK
jgi:PKD repeat protein